MREALRQKRLEGGLSPAGVARAIGIKKRMYYYIESGTAYGSGQVRDKLVTFFGIPADILLSVTDDKI